MEPTTAILTIVGITAQPPLHLLLHDGRPTEVAGWLAATIAAESQLPLGLRAQAAAIDCSYHYCLNQTSERIRLECWRRHRHSQIWQRRCGPMELGQFIRRFQLPGGPQHASS